jgi:hypothetical protein
MLNFYRSTSFGLDPFYRSTGFGFDPGFARQRRSNKKRTPA